MFCLCVWHPGRAVLYMNFWWAEEALEKYCLARVFFAESRELRNNGTVRPNTHDQRAERK